MQLAGQHQLRYFVTGGTLLGAVRHQGFIPWDDDIDVVMPRPDFERLSALMRREPTADHTWSDFRTTSDYPFAWAKLGLAGTQYLEYRTEHLSMPHTIAIDVFPLDGVPFSRALRLLHHIACRVLQVRIASGARRSWIRAAIVRLLTVLPRSWAVWSYERVVFAVPYDRSRLVANVAGLSGYERNVVPRAWFGQVTYLQFENQLVAAPAMWHQYLRQLYDDYMRLPPESEQRSPHEPRWDLGTYAQGGEPAEAASPPEAAPARRR
jgi:phosphorylcholine metabolism protein LicD